MTDKKKAKRWQDDFKDDGLSEGLCCTICGEVKETEDNLLSAEFGDFGRLRFLDLYNQLGFGLSFRCR